MIRTQIYLPKTLYQTIASVAQQEKKPAAQVIRDLLATGLKHKNQLATIGQALINLTTVKARASKDTSMKIDDYLYNV